MQDMDFETKFEQISISCHPEKEFIVVGSANADIFIEVDRLPKQGETISARNSKTGYMKAGGKGANQAATLGKLGGVTKFACQFGHDVYAEQFKTTLTRNNVDCSLCQYTKDKSCPSGSAFIFLEPSGQNSIIIVGGANKEWEKELSKQLVQSISNSSIILLQMEIPQYVNESVIRLAHQNGCLVFQDAGGEDRRIARELLEITPFFCPNETELSRLVDLPVNDVPQAIQAAQNLQRKHGAQNVLVTLGKLGAILVMKSGEIYEQSAYKVNVVDTTGAGDCFRAAFALSYAHGFEVQKCLKFASAASSICIQKHGSIDSIPSIDEVNNFLMQQ